MSSGYVNNNINNYSYISNVNNLSASGDTKTLVRSFYQEMETLMRQMADPTAPLVSTSFGITVPAEEKSGFLGTVLFNQSLNIGSTAIENALSYESFLTKIFSEAGKLGG